MPAPPPPQPQPHPALAARAIIVSGAGAAGAAFALALIRNGIPADRIVLADPDLARLPAQRPDDARILALNTGVCRFLVALGVWGTLRKDAYPMRAIAISDTALDEDIRPNILAIERAEGDEPLAHLIPLVPLVSALRDACREAGIQMIAARIDDFTASTDAIDATLGLETIRASLLVAADGARSHLRGRAGIPFHGWRYDQTAIVATIRHGAPHHGEAIQHFLPAGPFALLPLHENRSSLVWSEDAALAREILSQDRKNVLREIEKRAAGRRGEILAIEALTSHPLSLGISRRFFAGRLALIADAAHVVHPLAGQGLNLGLEDAAMLAELVSERLALGLDPGAPEMLETYQQRRRPAAAAMGAATDGINRLFSNDRTPLRLVRDFAMALIDRSPRLKNCLVLGASGITPLSPRVFRDGRFDGPIACDVPPQASAG